MIKYFFGDDNFRIKQEVLALAEKEKAELTYFGKGDFKLFANQVVARSFFDPKRIFVLTELGSNLKDAELKEFIRLLEGLDKNTLVILVEVKEPSKKLLKDLELEVMPFEVLKGQALVRHIKEKVSKEGGDIAPLAAERLAGYVGSNLWQLEEEIKKLVLYKKDGSEVVPIDSADVDLLVHANFEANIFNLVDAIATKNTRKAEKLINSFIVEGENPLYLLSMITRQIRNIAMIKFEDLSKEAFAKKAGLHPFVAQKTKEQARNFSPAEIKVFYEKLIAADLSLKSGGDPVMALQSIII